jgi:hypothetical protein
MPNTITPAITPRMSTERRRAGEKEEKPENGDPTASRILRKGFLFGNSRGICITTTGARAK